MKPVVITPAEAEAMALFFRHTWLGYDETRRPLRELLLRVERYVEDREAESTKVAR